MPFNIIRDDITKSETDAIVNAANSKLLEGGGVCGAIFSAAGKENLQKECNKIGYCGIGEAVITKGYNLKAKYVIHTVGPIYGQNPENEEKQLYSCYQASLKLAKKKRIKSIAFPVISSGIYGYPKAEAIKIATRAIKDFLAENEMDVRLVVYDQKTFQISEKLFKDVQSFIDEKLIIVEKRSQIAEVESKKRPDIAEGWTLTFKDADDGIWGAPCPSPTYSATYSDADDSEWCAPCLSPTYSAKSSLKKKKSLEDLMKVKVETFSEMLLRLIDEKGMTDVEVYKRANIDRKLFSKIRKKDYTPKKVTVVALIVALRLDMREARMLLGRAGFAFTQSSKFDVIIQYFIEQKNYDVFEINETLFAFEQQLLGA